MLPPNARCLGCDYLLQGLDSARCPECGRAFDPANRRSFYVGRPMPKVLRRLLKSPGFCMERVRVGLLLFELGK